MMAGQMVMSQMNKRSVNDEQPYLDPRAQQAIQGRAAAQTYANASVDPNSEWFRNLSALFREGAEADIMQGIRTSENRRLRADARGIGDASDRQDEAVSRNISRLFYRAGIDSRAQAGSALRQASTAAAGGSSIPESLFRTMGEYGNAEAARKDQLFDQLGGIVVILGKRGEEAGWFSGGAGSVPAYGTGSDAGGLSASQGGMWW